MRRLFGVLASIVLVLSTFVHGQDRVTLLLLAGVIVLMEINENINERFGS